MMLRKSNQEFDFEYDMNPYESFMRNHLKHYGYYTGKNETYRSAPVYEDWEKNYGYTLSDASDTEYENQALQEHKLDPDNRTGEDQRKSTQITYSYQAGKMVPKLREPRNLYALNKEYGPQQAPRWPADLEVLPERVSHITAVPNIEESFYVPSGLEKTPHHSTDGDGKVVFYNPPTKESYFLRSRVGGSKHGCPFRAIKLKSEDDTTLLFESRFESGNLMKATKIGEYEYNLLLRYDLYTKKHTQWYYFQVKNTRPGVRYRFTITNFMKSGSLYNMGMKPLMYSKQDAETKGIGWRRAGQDIKYYKNNIQRTDVKGEKYFYSLTWTCTFPNANDTCYFAHCYPYTYSNLQDYLLNVSNDPVKNRFCKVRVLCRSLAGNCVYILTITTPSKHPSDAKSKKAVVLTARVHPGETNASWMMKGFLDYLTGNSADAKLLRDTFVFKIVPMLNPDGVIVGNYRCSLSGRDLNRNYKSILKDSFPSVANTKVMIKKLQDEREIIMYCDLHGHSRKQNVFIYGCDNKHSASRRLRERIFPVILGRNAPEKFNYKSCKFKVQKSKEGTGRVVIWQMGIMNSFTMEATFCGSSLGSRNKTHFTTKDFEAMGYHFCDSLLDLCDPDLSKEKMRQDILAHLQRTGSPMPMNGIVDLNEDYTSAVESSTSGSDSSVDDGLPVHLLALAPKLTKKKKLKSKKERDKKRSSLEKQADKETKEKEKISNQTDNEEKKPSTPKPNEKKKMRYRHTDRLYSAGRRSNTPGRHDGVPVFVQERCEERQLKKTEYLEAITNAYLMSGVLPPATQDQTTFHYSQGNHGLAATGVPLGHVEGLCPHHEKAFAENYVANQLADLQFADEKFDWSHSVVDTRKTIQSLGQRAPSPFQNRPCNKQINSTLSMRSGKWGSNEKVVPVGIDNTMVDRRSRSPLKSMSLLTDDSQTYTEIVTKGFTSKSLTRSKCPSATSIHVYNGRASSGKQQGSPLIRSSSRQLTRGNLEKNETSRQGPRPSSSSVDQTLSVALNQNQHVTFTPQTNAMSASRNSSEAPSQIGITSQYRGTSVNSSTVTASVPKYTGVQTVVHPNEKNETDGRVSSPTSSKQSDNITLNIDKDEKPSPRNTALKSHRCSTESTPISDSSTFSFRYKSANSSHHFSNSQNFYGNTVIMQNCKGAVQIEGRPTTRYVKRNESGSSSAMSFRSSESSDVRSVSSDTRPKSTSEHLINYTNKRTETNNTDNQHAADFEKTKQTSQTIPYNTQVFISDTSTESFTPKQTEKEHYEEQEHAEQVGPNVNYNNVNDSSLVDCVTNHDQNYEKCSTNQNRMIKNVEGMLAKTAELRKNDSNGGVNPKLPQKEISHCESDSLDLNQHGQPATPKNIGTTKSTQNSIDYSQLLDNKHAISDRFMIARNPQKYFQVSRLELQDKAVRNSMDDAMFAGLNSQPVIPEIEGRRLITPREHIRGSSSHSARVNHSPRLPRSIPSPIHRGGDAMSKYQTNYSLNPANQLEIIVNKPPSLKPTDSGGIRSQIQRLIDPESPEVVMQNQREAPKVITPCLVTGQVESYTVTKGSSRDKQPVKKESRMYTSRTPRFKEPSLASVAFSNPAYIYSIEQHGVLSGSALKCPSLRSNQRKY
ncbi:uncharacterized protein LOC117108244 isoform X2 [Anneissia japonica]|uniref:uncharacterized protein LOC117108244 isoform X2 n=1 Tax=Anneissia japonica TaxID=1529436 RepID=UPI0014259BAD|nr:uncharacterized protein LOC117108244 isoform X2 [Anneissia japonica]